MPREYNLYLRDILEAIKRIEQYTQGMDYEAFMESYLVQDGVIRNLMLRGSRQTYRSSGSSIPSG